MKDPKQSEEIEFTDEIKTIHIPVTPEINGESKKALDEFIDKLGDTKISSIKYCRTINYGEWPFDLTEIIIEK